MRKNRYIPSSLNTDRINAIEAESTVLVNWGKRSKFGSIIPIYEFISDVSKREALQQAYQTYLSK